MSANIKNENTLITNLQVHHDANIEGFRKY